MHGLHIPSERVDGEIGGANAALADSSNATFGGLKCARHSSSILRMREADSRITSGFETGNSMPVLVSGGLQSSSSEDFVTSPSSSRLDRLEGTVCCETADSEGRRGKGADSDDSEGRRGKGADSDEQSSIGAACSTAKTGDKFVTVKQIFLQLWIGRLLHCGDPSLGRDRKSLELSGQAQGDMGSAVGRRGFAVCTGMTSDGAEAQTGNVGATQYFTLPPQSD
ncbi:hypothetical protein F5887DRAFT_919025 [Amanita rubescens]|nr:hypothetical protein F5887DRAFT_919025 [Amanita rubescens]